MRSEETRFFECGVKKNSSRASFFLPFFLQRERATPCVSPFLSPSRIMPPAASLIPITRACYPLPSTPRKLQSWPIQGPRSRGDAKKTFNASKKTSPSSRPSSRRQRQRLAFLPSVAASVSSASPDDVPSSPASTREKIIE